MTGKILVIRGGAIGDFVLTLPVLAALRKRFPQARLEILGYPHIASLASAAGLADDLRSLESPGLTGFFTTGSQLNPAWVDYFAGFDLILSYVFDPEEIFARNIRRCSRAEFVTAAHRPQETQEVHATTFFLKPLEQIGIHKPESTPKLELVSTHKRLSGECIAAHPGSGSHQKNWPEERWLHLLADLLAVKKWNCLMVGGEAEGDRLQRFEAKLSSHRLQVAANLPLVELAQRLSSCAAFVGHDSGISHLAAALGLPTLVLWGPTNERIWRPLGANVRILRSGGELSELTPETVRAELEAVICS